jgi:hypothetical protein
MTEPGRLWSHWTWGPSGQAPESMLADQSRGELDTGSGQTRSDLGQELIDPGIARAGFTAARGIARHRTAGPRPTASALRPRRLRGLPTSPPEAVAPACGARGPGTDAAADAGSAASAWRRLSSRSRATVTRLSAAALAW